jgi:thiamine biosynthesis lipoprotein
MLPPDEHEGRFVGDAVSGWRLDARALEQHARAASQRRAPLDVRVRPVPAGGGDVGVAFAPVEARPAWEFRAFGARWRLYHDGLVSARLARRTASHVLLDEMQWSRFSPGSDTRQVNALAGQRVRVAASTLAIATVANAFVLDTDGIFQPLVGHALESWGWPDASVEPVGVAASPGEVLVPDQLVDVDAIGRSLAVPVGAKLDLGGIAPSFAALRAAGVLAGLAAGVEALLVAGSHAIAIGAPAQLRVDLRPDGPELRIGLERGHGAACSTSARRPWTNGDGRLVHDLVDPETGGPAHAGAAVAVADSVVQADVLAKVVRLRPELAERAADACLAVVDGVERHSAAWAGAVT